MTRQKLTDRTVKAAQPGYRRRLIWDTVVQGFALSIEPTGGKAFKLVYSYRGRTRWYTIGKAKRLDLADARAEAKRLLARMELEGVDVQAERIKQLEALTFGALAEKFFAARADTQKSIDQYRDHYRRYLKPQLAEKPAEQLRTSDFAAVKRELADSGKTGTISPVMAVASAIMGWGIEECLIELSANPVRGLRYGSDKKAKQRSRALTHDEIRALYQNLDHVGFAQRALLLIMLYTGQRGDEVRHMRWCDIEGSWWTQQTNKEDRVHRVWLANPVLDTVGQFTPAHGPYVLGGGSPMRSLDSRVLKRLRTLSGVRDFKPHQLRHTADTEMSRCGISEEHRRKVLNHAEGGMTAVYGHYDFDVEKRRALQQLARHVGEVLGGQDQSKVVRLG